MRKSLYVTSAARDLLTTNENFTITDTAKRFSIPPKEVKLTYATIPNTWNNIVTGSNDTFNLIEPPNPGILVTIPAGNYTGSALASALQTALNVVAVLNTYTVLFNSNPVGFTITATGNFQLDFTGPAAFATRIGFVPGTTTVSAGIITSPQVPQINVDNEICICSNLVGGIDNGVSKFAPGAATNDQILAVIPIGSSSYGSNIVFFNSTDNPFYPITQSAWGKIQLPTDNTSKKVSFFLAFPSGFPVSLNGAIWSFTLSCNF